MPSWVCQWKPFWIPVGDSFKKAFVEEWVFISSESSDEQNVTDFPVLHSIGQTDCIRDDHPPTPRPSRQFDSLPWEPTRPQDNAYFWERIEAPLPPLRPRPKCNFIHPRQLRPFPERLELPFSNDEILCGYEEIDSQHEILVQHMVDIHEATADFRDASERKPASTILEGQQTWRIFNTGVISGTIRLTTTGTFASKKALRIPETVLSNATFARY